jgi:hypothetical protein
MDPLNMREPDDCRSSVTQDLQEDMQEDMLLFNGDTSQRMEKAHLTKLAPASQ